MWMLNNEHIKAIDVDITEMVSLIFKGLQPQSVQKDVERTDNVHRLLEGKYLSNLTICRRSSWWASLSPLYFCSFLHRDGDCLMMCCRLRKGRAPGALL